MATRVVAARVAAFVCVAVLQAGIMPWVNDFGAHVNLLIVFALVCGLRYGIDAGAIAGFAAGLIVDLLQPVPIGLGALAGTIGVFVCTSALFQYSGEEPSRATSAVFVGVSYGFCQVLYFVVGELFGQSMLAQSGVVATTLVGSAVAMLLARPTMRFVPA